MISEPFSIIDKLLAIGHLILEMHLSKREKHEKQEEALKIIIYNQRELKRACKGDYDANHFFDYENQITDYLQTYFGENFSLCFAKGNACIYWALRYKSEISNEVIDESLSEFIELCRVKGFDIQ